MKRQRSFEQKQLISKKIKFNNESNSFLFLFDLNQEPYIAYNIIGYLEGDSKSFIQMTSVCNKMKEWRTYCSSFDSFLMFIKNKSQEQMNMIKNYLPQSQYQMKIPINCLFPVEYNQIVFIKNVKRIVFSNIKILINHCLNDGDFQKEIESVMQKIDFENRKQQAWKKKFDFDFYQLKFSSPNHFFKKIESSPRCSMCPFSLNDFEQLILSLFDYFNFGNRQTINENHIAKSQFIDHLNLDLHIKTILLTSTNQNIEREIQLKKDIISKFEFSNLIHLTMSINQLFWLENLDWCSFKQKPKLKSLDVSIDSSSSPNQKIKIKSFMSLLDFSRLKSLKVRILTTNDVLEHVPHDLEIEKWNITHNLDQLFLFNVKLPSDESNPDELSNKIKKLKWISDVTQFALMTSIQDKKYLQLINCMKKLKKMMMIVFSDSSSNHDENFILDMSHLNYQYLDCFLLNVEKPFQNKMAFKLSNQWKQNLKKLQYENCDLVSDCQFGQLDDLRIEHEYASLCSMEEITKKFEYKQFQSITKLSLNIQKIKVSKDQDFSFLNHCKNIEHLVLKCDEFNLIRNEDKFCPKLKSISITCNKMIVPFAIFHNSWANLNKMEIMVSKTPISATFLLNKCLDNLKKIKIETPINELKSWTNLLTLCSKNENIQSICLNLEKIKDVKIKNREIEKFNNIFKSIQNQKLIAWTNIKNLKQ